MFKTKRFFSGFLALLSILILMTGCDDRTNVGIGLVDAQTEESKVITLSASSLQDNGLGDVTGGNASSGASRALAGVVDDPVAGHMEAVGLLDFVASSQFGTSFLSQPVTFADLTMSIDYVYGDTTQPVTLEMYQVNESWISAFTRADTTIGTGALVLTTTIPAVEGDHVVTLPAEWVSAFDGILRSSTFTDDFHGFALRATSGNAILGVGFSGTSLRASSTPGDTVSFSLSKVFTSSSRIPSSASSEYLLLQDGAANGLDVSFPFLSEEFPEALVHRVLVRLNTVDLSDLYPSGFNRPVVSLIGLRVVADDDVTRLVVEEVGVASDGSLTFDNTILTNVVQSVNLDKSSLDRFELYLPSNQSGVGFLAIQFGAISSESLPRAIVTFTPLK